YAMLYATHNYTFYTYATMMSGRRADSLRAARAVAATAADDPMDMAGLVRVQPLFVMERFSMWEDILRQPPPRADRLYDRGIWHYARGMAYAATGRAAAARREAAELARIAADEGTAGFDVPAFYGRSQLRIADRVLAGAIARAEGRLGDASRALRTAVRLQDDLPYMEPPYWYVPVRHHLGAVLLEAGQPRAAERVYREDLERNPANGWSLFGLARSLDAQGRAEAAAATRATFEHVWLRADVTPRDSSRAAPATRVARARAR
ncbi:MAG TPA: tetratricopeptide repeat protein, partial [Kofleriaceae bacterium]|nr:tetratricopeptide repeat protein [Kofleriaceae bacterium]